jgi:hypothetical protein
MLGLGLGLGLFGLRERSPQRVAKKNLLNNSKGRKRNVRAWRPGGGVCWKEIADDGGTLELTQRGPHIRVRGRLAHGLAHIRRSVW